MDLKNLNSYFKRFKCFITIHIVYFTLVNFIMWLRYTHHNTKYADFSQNCCTVPKYTFFEQR